MHLKQLQKLNPFSRLPGEDLVGIDLSNDTLKIAHLALHPKKEIVQVFCREIKGLSDEEIAKAVLAGLHDFKISKFRALIALSSQLVIPKNIEVPSVDAAEIKEIINLQAGRHTPYTREEIIVDYIPIGTYKENYTKILLLIVNSAVIKRQFVLLDKAQLKVEKALFAQEAIAQLTGKIFKSDTASSPVGLIHIEEASSDFAVIFKNKVIFIRSIPLGRQHLTSAAENSESKFPEEIKKSLEAYQAENIEKNPYMLVLTGACEELANLDNILNDAVRLPVRVLPYQQTMPLGSQVVAQISANKNLSFLNVLAALLAFGDCRVNFIPEEVKLKHKLQERSKDLIQSGFFVLSILILVFFNLISKLYFKNSYLKTLEDKFKSVETEAQKLEKDFQKNNQIRRYLSGRDVSFKALVELHELAPLNLALNDIRFDREGKFVIKGTAESMSTVFSFIDAMSKSKYFNDVKTKGTTKRQENKKDVIDFEINCLVNKVVEE